MAAHVFKTRITGLMSSEQVALLTTSVCFSAESILSLLVSVPECQGGLSGAQLHGDSSETRELHRKCPPQRCVRGHLWDR